MIARVLPGRGEGRRLGFPTLNVEIPSAWVATGPDALPHGIYAGWAWIDGERHSAAIHYGPVPVFGVQTPSLEIHVIDRDIPKAPAELGFEMVTFIREIKDFPDQAALIQAMQDDIMAARAALSMKAR